MKTKKTAPATSACDPASEEIRDYAYHLYIQKGCQDGHDLDHWLEAEACLRASIPPEHARTRLHHHRLSVSAPGIKSAS